MEYTLTIRREAEYDLKVAFDYYENIRDGLGHDFILCVEEAFSKISRNPSIYKKTYGVF